MVFAFVSIHWRLRRGAIHSIASVVWATSGICPSIVPEIKTALKLIKMREDVSVAAGAQQEEQSGEMEMIETFHM